MTSQNRWQPKDHNSQEPNMVMQAEVALQNASTKLSARTRMQCNVLTYCSTTLQYILHLICVCIKLYPWHYLSCLTAHDTTGVACEGSSYPTTCQQSMIKKIHRHRHARCRQDWLPNVLLLSCRRPLRFMDHLQPRPITTCHNIPQCSRLQTA